MSAAFSLEGELESSVVVSCIMPGCRARTGGRPAASLTSCGRVAAVVHVPQGLAMDTGERAFIVALQQASAQDGQVETHDRSSSDVRAQHDKKQSPQPGTRFTYAVCFSVVDTARPEYRTTRARCLRY